MISEDNVNLVSGDGVSRYSFLQNNNKTITRFGALIIKISLSVISLCLRLG